LDDYGIVDGAVNADGTADVLLEFGAEEFVPDWLDILITIQNLANRLLPGWWIRVGGRCIALAGIIYTGPSDIEVRQTSGADRPVAWRILSEAAIAFSAFFGPEGLYEHLLEKFQVPVVYVQLTYNPAGERPDRQ
jgi:hypothetical protein